MYGLAQRRTPRCLNHHTSTLESEPLQYIYRPPINALPACAPSTDCSVCQRGYSPSLSTTCTPCSPSRRQWLVAIAVITVVIVGCAMVVFAVHLVSTSSEDQRGCHIYYTILRGLPLQAFKTVVVVWQILTQVLVATATPL